MAGLEKGRGVARHSVGRGTSRGPWARGWGLSGLPCDLARRIKGERRCLGGISEAKKLLRTLQMPSDRGAGKGRGVATLGAGMGGRRREHAPYWTGRWPRAWFWVAKTLRSSGPLQNDLTFLRIRSKKHEIMVAPGEPALSRCVSPVGEHAAQNRSETDPKHAALTCLAIGDAKTRARATFGLADKEYILIVVQNPNAEERL